jgi:hypothetical protein
MSEQTKDSEIGASENPLNKVENDEKDHGLEESICRSLIGQQKYKPFFYYCKICSKVEFQNLTSMKITLDLKIRKDIKQNC